MFRTNAGGRPCRMGIGEAMCRSAGDDASGPSSSPGVPMPSEVEIAGAKQDGRREGERRRLRRAPGRSGARRSRSGAKQQRELAV